MTATHSTKPAERRVIIDMTYNEAVLLRTLVGADITVPKSLRKDKWITASEVDPLSQMMSELHAELSSINVN